MYPCENVEEWIVIPAKDEIFLKVRSSIIFTEEGIVILVKSFECNALDSISVNEEGKVKFVSLMNIQRKSLRGWKLLYASIMSFHRKIKLKLNLF